ncbi:acyl-CoA--6-aminopenicillanic acid acyl-transferase [soil metagenome]
MGVLALLGTMGWFWFVSVIAIHPPATTNAELLQLQREEPSPGFYTIGNNWMQKNDVGLYELYVEGAPFERGVIYGKLAQELVIKQEEYFVAQIQQLIPSEFYQSFLKYLIGWFNRNLDEAIPEENLLEIYGVSQSAADDFEFIGTKYQRILNYHAAHDIGHALQDKGMVVGCTSFGAWGDKTADSSLIIGRNFDFYVGDSFARDKIVMFVNPDAGHPFMMVTWGGFTGVVSGMNMHGLTVTINAAKSDYPTGAATPISIVARQILQYAGTIEEAFAIAKKYETFVAEAIFVGSAHDGETAIIEKTPTKTELYRLPAGGNEIVCSNHFQGGAFASDEGNLWQQKESSSTYRYQRMNELLAQHQPLTPETAAVILRDTKGLGGTDIGLGNENAINQLMAHHSIIFMPEQRLVWVSANPVPYNVYVAYDLNKVFGSYVGLKQPQAIDEPQLRIAADSFLTNGYGDYLGYKRLRTELKKLVSNKLKTSWSDAQVTEFIALNPHYFETYELLGDYFAYVGNYQRAISCYYAALNGNIPLLAQKKNIEDKVNDLEDKTP